MDPTTTKAMNAKPPPGTLAAPPVGMLSGMKAAARFIGISPRTLFDWIQDGHINVIRHSKRKTFFRPSDLLKAVESIGQAYVDGKQ